MSDPGPLDVGSIYASLGFRLDSRNATKFEKTLDRLESRAAKPIQVALSFDDDDRELRQFNKELDAVEARVKTREKFQVKLGATYTSAKFDQFNKAVAKAKVDAARPVEVELGADVEKAGFDQFDRQVKEAEARAKKPVEVDLGADVDTRPFNEYGREIDRAQARAKSPIRQKLETVLDAAGFGEFQRRAAAARVDAHNEAKIRLGADYDRRGFDAYLDKMEEVRAKSARKDRFQMALGGGMSKEAAAGFKAFEGAIDGVSKAASNGGGSIGGFGGKLGGLGKFGAAAAAGLVVLIPVMVALAGAAVAVAGSLAAAVAGMGAVAVGAAAAAGPLLALGGAVAARFGAIKEAYAAVSAQQDQSASSAVSNAAAQKQSAQQIASAQQSLGDARRTGAEQVAAAEQALGDARREGAQQVADAEQQLADTRREGAKNIERAEETLADARKDGAASVVKAEQQLAEARATGARAVRDAERDLADVRAQGAASVRSADQALAGAQRDARAAQDGLTDARARARRELYDLAEASRDAKDAEEGSQISLARALERLKQVQADPKATLLDIREAQFAVKLAREGVEDAAVARKRADEDAAKGTDTVKIARDNLADANGRVADAERGVRDAQSESARAISDAQQVVARARREAAEDERQSQADLVDARVKASESIRDAQSALGEAQTEAGRANVRAARAVASARTDAARTTARAQAAVGKASADAARQTERAQQAVRQAQEAATDALAAQGAGADAAAAKLAKLSDTERKLLTTFRGFSASLSKTFQPATDAIFGSVDGALKRIEPVIGRFQGRFKGIGEEIGRLIESASKSLAGPEWSKAFDSFAATARRIIKPLGNAAGSAVNAIRNIAVAAQPFVVKLADGLERFFSGLEAKTSNVGKVRETIGKLVDSTRSWGRLIGSLGGLLMTVFGGGKKEGDSLVDSLTRAIDRLNRFLKTKEGREEMLRFFRNAADTARSFFKVLGTVIKWVIRVSSALIDFNREGGRALRDIQRVVDVVATRIRNQFRGMATSIVGMLTQILGGVSTTLNGLSKLPVVGKKFKGMADEIDNARDKLDKWRESVNKAGKQEAWNNNMRQQADRVTDLKDDLSRLEKGSDKYKDKQDDLRTATRKLNEKMAEGQQAGYKMEKGTKKAAAGAGAASRSAGKAGGLIASAFNVLAKQFDIKEVKYDASKLSGAGMGATAGGTAGTSNGGGMVTAKGAGVPRGKRFFGGGVPNPGSGTADDHILVNPAGQAVAAMSGTEGVLNGPQMGVVNVALQVAQQVGALPFNGLADLWGSGMRHGFATGGPLGQLPGIPRFAKGGGFGAVPGFPGEEAAKSVIPKITATASKFPGLRLTDAYDRDRSAGHKSPGHNVTGTAADFAGPDAVMDRAVKYLVGKGYLVGYDGRFGSQAWPGHGPTASAGANAHLHVEFGGKGGDIKGGTAAVAEKLAGVKIKGRGPMAKMLQKAADKMRAGGQKKIDSAANSALATPMGGGGDGRAGTAQVRKWATTALSRAGSPFPPTAANIAALVGRIMQESGGDPNIQNNWDINAKNGTPSIGLAQTIGPTFAAYRDKKLPNNPRHPIANLAAALNYMRARYGRVVGPTGKGYAGGGKLRRFLNVGGKLRKFAGGGKIGARRIDRINDAVGGITGSNYTPPTMGRVKALQTDRSRRYDYQIARVDKLNNQYTLADRKYSLSTEELVDEDGNIDKGAINKRVEEIEGLMGYRRKIVEAQVEARNIADAIRASYRTVIRRLRRTLKAAKKKKRPGIESTIKSYQGRLNEWSSTRSELATETIPSARLDLAELEKERDEVKGTKGTPIEKEPPDEKTPPDEETPPGDTVTPPGDIETPPDTTDPSTVAAPPDPKEIAAQAQAALATFQQSRAELFGTFGANFAKPGPPGASPFDTNDAQAAGARFFGGSTGGADGNGTVTGAGGSGGNNIEKVEMNFYGPQPTDPHVTTKTMLHEIAAA